MTPHTDILRGTLTEAEEQRRGEVLAEMLALRPIRTGNEKGRYQTKADARMTIREQRSVDSALKLLAELEGRD